MPSSAKVRDWMTNPVISVTPDTPISSAHQLMKKEGIRRLLVMENDELKGVVTIGDVREARPSDAVTLSIWELNYLWAQLSVGKVMSTDVMTVSADDPISHAAEIMLEKKVSGLPVVDNGALVGIITESDIFRMLVKTSDEPVTE